MNRSLGKCVYILSLAKSSIVESVSFKDRLIDQLLGLVRFLHGYWARMLCTYTLWDEQIAYSYPNKIIVFRAFLGCGWSGRWQKLELTQPCLKHTVQEPGNSAAERNEASSKVKLSRKPCWSELTAVAIVCDKSIELNDFDDQMSSWTIGRRSSFKGWFL